MMEEKLKHLNNLFEKCSLLSENDFPVLQKPFLKWVGGKTQIIKDILQKFPIEIENYHEVFLGGGSVLLALLSLQKAGKIQIKNKIYASDINETLIYLFKNIQNHKEELFTFLQQYIQEYESCTGTLINRKPKTKEEGLTSKESYYYWLRNEFNQMDKQSVECSALFLFLNKTCFRGVYREGPHGFNVPFGHYKKTPTFLSKEEFEHLYELIKDVEFTCCNFEDSFSKMQEGDFVYLDPPYAPQKSDSFVSYTKDGFNIEKHQTLFKKVCQLHQERIKFLMSNAKVELVLQNFKDYQIEEISCRRAIHSKNPGSKAMEVLITNFEG